LALYRRAKNDVTIRIPLGLQQANLAGLVDADEAVRHRGGAHGVDRRHQAAIGTVFKTNRHRQTGCHFTVSLRFSGTRADGGPAEQIAKVLWAIWIERFCRQRQAPIL